LDEDTYDAVDASDPLPMYTVSRSQGCQMVCFEPEIPILVKFGGPWNRKSCYIFLPFGIF
jgi:hypothetical protein